MSSHMIVLRLAGGQILLSCSCLRVPGRAGRHGKAGRPGYDLIDARPLFPAAEVITAWRGYHGWET